jgi:hypothetical protein
MQKKENSDPTISACVGRIFKEDGVEGFFKVSGPPSAASAASAASKCSK